MDKERQRSNEFRRYRQVLTTLYLATALAGAALLAASVAKQLLFRHPSRMKLRGPRLTADNPAPAELVRCSDDVLRLLTRLGKVTTELLGSPPRGDRSEISSAWEDFSRAWWNDYKEVGARCRFAELADTHMGVAYDRMAKVYSRLPAMRLKYQSLLVRFDDEQAAELAQMRRALDRSRKVFAERAAATSGP